MPFRPIPILVVDDEPDHARLIKEALEDMNPLYQVYVVGSGEDAIAYLAGEGQFVDRVVFPFPVLLLLDLKMPGGRILVCCAGCNLIVL